MANPDACASAVTFNLSLNSEVLQSKSHMYSKLHLKRPLTHSKANACLLLCASAFWPWCPQKPRSSMGSLYVTSMGMMMPSDTFALH